MMGAMEVWLHGFAVPHRVAELARRAEAWGFSGLLLADSQNLTADIWVELTLAGAATSTLWVSSLSQIGLRAQSPGEFERSLACLQGLLRGERVGLDGGASAIVWLAADGPGKVPVHVAASGPRVIAAAAKHAEGVDLTVGAELERLRWGAALVRESAAAGVSVGAYVNVAVDPDRDRARALVKGSAATFARFSAATRGDGLSEVTRSGARAAALGYEKDRHGQAAHAGRLDDAFIDAFAIAGPAGEVQARLAEIGETGIERVIVVPCSLDSADQDVLRSNERLARDVLPGLAAA